VKGNSKLGIQDASNGIFLIDFAANPLEHVAQMFREYMLEKALFSLVSPARSKEGPTQSAEVSLYTQLLSDSAASTTKPVSLSGGGISTVTGRQLNVVLSN
jgi:hypothetical protein